MQGKRMAAFVRSCQFFLLEVYEALNSSFLMFLVQMDGLILDLFHSYKARQQMTPNQDTAGRNIIHSIEQY